MRSILEIPLPDITVNEGGAVGAWCIPSSPFGKWLCIGFEFRLVTTAVIETRVPYLVYRRKPDQDRTLWQTPVGIGASDTANFRVSSDAPYNVSYVGAGLHHYGFIPVVMYPDAMVSITIDQAVAGDTVCCNKLILEAIA